MIQKKLILYQCPPVVRSRQGRRIRKTCNLIKRSAKYNWRERNRSI